MARVKKDVILAAKREISSLPKDIISKCGLCKETLTHYVKTVEVKTGAPTKTVCDLFTYMYNTSVPDNDKVKSTSFRSKVLDAEGKKNPKCTKSTNKKYENTPHTPVSTVNDENASRISISTVKYEEDMDWAIHYLNLEELLRLNKFSPWPKEIVRILKRGLATKYHPDTGGSNDNYRKFEKAIQILIGERP